MTVLFSVLCISWSASLDCRLTSASVMIFFDNVLLDGDFPIAVLIAYDMASFVSQPVLLGIASNARFTFVVAHTHMSCTLI